MLPTRLCFLLIIVAFFKNIHAIDRDDDDDDDDDHGECARNQISLLTYNAGLTPLIDKYEERKARIPQALHEVDADVVCLQEVWYESDLRGILKALWWKYPFSWSFLHSSVYSTRELFRKRDTSGRSFVCDVDAYPAFAACVVSKCSDLTGYPLAICGLQMCTIELFSLPTDCISCVASSAQTLEVITALCVTPGQGRDAFRVRYQPQDLLVLSKRPIRRARRFDFIPDIPQIYPRGLLEVDISRVGKVLCTHLTAQLELPGLDYAEVILTQTLGISSYEEQQLGEIEKINNMYSDGCLIIAGDLNTGPVVEDEGIAGEFPDNYASLVGEVFKSPYIEQDGRCTYCANNPIAFPINSTIDHVLLRGYKTVSASRVIDNQDDPLSDHYGVKVTFCRD